MQINKMCLVYSFLLILGTWKELWAPLTSAVGYKNIRRALSEPFICNLGEEWKEVHQELLKPVY